MPTLTERPGVREQIEAAFTQFRAHPDSNDGQRAFDRAQRLCAEL